MIDECYSRALQIIERNVHKDLLYASTFYRQVWTRDVAVTALALYWYPDPRIRRIVENTLRFLGRYQAKRGQIPTYVDIERSYVYWYSIDSTLWWIIACTLYDCCDRDRILRAYDWCSKQVLDDSMLITSIRGTDWMDASIGREGKVLYINVLWYAATKLLEKRGLLTDSVAEELRKRINVLFWPTRDTIDRVAEWGLAGSYRFLEDFVDPNRKHYVHFVSYEYLDDRFASLGNLLAILFGVADLDKSERILEFVEIERIDKPYPVKCLHPVVYLPGLVWVPEVDIFRRKSQKCLPYHYHNGGIWPFIGGFYVAILASFDRVKAREKLERLAEANRLGKDGEWEFNEWLHGIHGKPMGSKHQLWNAATYILAYQALHEGIDVRKVFGDDA